MVVVVMVVVRACSGSGGDSGVETMQWWCRDAVVVAVLVMVVVRACSGSGGDGCESMQW